MSMNLFISLKTKHKKKKQALWICHLDLRLQKSITKKTKGLIRKISQKHAVCKTKIKDTKLNPKVFDKDFKLGE